MLHFNELRITPDNRYLIIDASVDNDSYFDDVVIDSIVIDTQDTYVANGPSSNPVYSFKMEDRYDLTYSVPEDCSCNPVLEDEDKSYCFTYGGEQSRHIRLILSYKDLNVSLCGNMFFVYVIASGDPSEDTPCGFDKNQIIGTVVNLYPLYQQTMCYIKELENDCQIPKGFINMILRFKSIELCIRTGNYPQAIKYWNKFFAGQDCQVPTYNCGCNGGSN